MSLTNLDFGVLGSNNIPTPDDTGSTGEATAKILHESVAKLNDQISVVTNGRKPEQLFRETLLGIACVFFVVTFLLAGQILYYRSVPPTYRTPAMKQTSWRYKSLCVTAVAFAYYGALSTSLLVLSVNGMSHLDIALAVIIVVFMGLPLPILAIVKLYRVKQIERLQKQGLDTKDLNYEKTRTQNIYKTLIGGTRPGCEWYSVLTLFRKMTMAAVTSLMVDFEYAQCWIIAGVYQLCLIANILSAPWEGGYKSGHFIIESTGQVLQLATCYVPIYYYHTSGSPNETSGLIVMFCQMAAILIAVIIGLPGLIVSIRDAMKERQKRKTDSKLRKSRGEVEEWQPPSSFIAAVVARRKSSKFFSKDFGKANSGQSEPEAKTIELPKVAEEHTTDVEQAMPAAKKIDDESCSVDSHEHAEPVPVFDATVVPDAPVHPSLDDSLPNDQPLNDSGPDKMSPTDSNPARNTLTLASPDSIAAPSPAGSRRLETDLTDRPDEDDQTLARVPGDEGDD
eukprot:c14755_g1_i1.p1 GENE.c14755_g1_i1~~c14755_g1_i1.p1  ORF type:complete len:566 (+),score=140.59 c14755_g1_i1:173-1699(+)